MAPSYNDWKREKVTLGLTGGSEDPATPAGSGGEEAVKP
jgi:hypothetical protein